MKNRFLLCVSLVFLGLSSVGLAKEPVRLGNSSKSLKIIKKVAPAYPEEAKKQNIQGKVVLDVTVDEQGKVNAIKTIKTANPSLAETATKAIKQWEYAPLLLDGKPKAFIVTVTINFALDKEKEKSEPAK